MISWTKRAALLTCCSLFLLTAAPLPSASAAVTSRAALPPFPVTLNGVELDSAYSKYPFLYMNSITYMPLTWNHLQSLNIKSHWSEEEGLMIMPNGDYPPPIQEGPPEQDLSDKRNAAAFSVKRLNQRLWINGTVIDNETEPYPFLTFRDVVYMPLTWRYVHELLHLEIRWDADNGLTLVGGQNVMGPVAGEDDHALYFSSMLLDPAKGVLKMDKSTYLMAWKNRESVKSLVDHTRTATPPYGGKPADVIREDRNLYYGGQLLYTLTDSDVWEAADYGPPVHTYTEFDAGRQGVIVTVNLRLPLPVIGPYHGTTYNFLVRSGKVSRLEHFNTRLSRVIPNPDGSVWIAVDRLPSRHGYEIGSARIGLMDPEGRIRLVNELLNEADVRALGLQNPDLPNPAGADGSLYVVMSGYTWEGEKKDTAGLYTLNTKLETERLTHSAAGDYYMDKNRGLYWLKGNNTIENVMSHEIHSWFDYELVRMDSPY
ncbi:hypothetical protein J2T17_000239 [Paenibacillus mucilaginosus]|uniref:hypothetical protein n=1 Tax=Paenibacillus mucilaginosus TaxID=61624 RepID=UPI003D210401